MISSQKVLLVHGYKTTPNGAWFPWLMSEVKRLAVFAFALDMPTPAVPLQAEWVSEIARAVDRHAGDDVYLVGEVQVAYSLSRVPDAASWLVLESELTLTLAQNIVHN